MKVIIAGSRSCTDYALLEKAIEESGFEITQVIYGGAQGADLLGKQWAIKNNISFETFLPDWNQFGNYAGNLRNVEMAKEADALIALWDGKSTGTEHMILTMKIYKKRNYVKLIPIKRDHCEKVPENTPKTGFFN